MELGNTYEMIIWTITSMRQEWACPFLLVNPKT